MKSWEIAVDEPVYSELRFDPCTESLCFTDSDDTASQASAGVSGRLRQLMATISQVVDVSVDDNGAAQDAVASGQRNLQNDALDSRTFDL